MKVSREVTVVVDGLLVHGRIKGPAPPAGKFYVDRIGFAGRVPLGNIDEKEEGLAWCYGHVTAREPKGRALLAANALGKPQRRAKPLDEMDKKFIEGKVTEAEWQSNLYLFNEDIANGFY
ncbi:MAG TPA: hypothetical protein VGY48_15985 [Vicinamibacterales bacterium]|jgi:hypothetical protein|nr:hypothetical protein [Vicinamibacterales bacterium]